MALFALKSDLVKNLLEKLLRSQEDQLQSSLVGLSFEDYSEADLKMKLLTYRLRSLDNAFIYN